MWVCVCGGWLFCKFARKVLQGASVSLVEMTIMYPYYMNVFLALVGQNHNSVLFSMAIPPVTWRHLRELWNLRAETSMGQWFDRRRCPKGSVHDICSVTAVGSVQLGHHRVTTRFDVLTPGSALTGKYWRFFFIYMIVFMVVGTIVNTKIKI